MKRLTKKAPKDRRYLVKSFERCMTDYHGYIANEILILKKKLPPSSVYTMDDLWQEAYLILFKVWTAYDPSRKIQFQTLLVRYLKRYFANILSYHYCASRLGGRQDYNFDLEALADVQATLLIYDEELRKLSLRYNSTQTVRKRRLVKVA